MIYYLIVAAVILLDRAVKYLIYSNMEVGQTIPVLYDVFHITYVQNQGAAFSMWEQQWVILIVFPAAALIAGLILLWIKRKKWNRLALIAVAFICGGGIGNLADRLAWGYVVDLFDFKVFPVFNIADIFICVGCGLLLLDVIFFEKEKVDHG